MSLGTGCPFIVTVTMDTPVAAASTVAFSATIESDVASSAGTTPPFSVRSAMVFSSAINPASAFSVACGSTDSYGAIVLVAVGTACVSSSCAKLTAILLSTSNAESIIINTTFIFFIFS